jgi:hypothetical protein
MFTRKQMDQSYLLSSLLLPLRIRSEPLTILVSQLSSEGVFDPWALSSSSINSAIDSMVEKTTCRNWIL